MIISNVSPFLFRLVCLYFGAYTPSVHPTQMGYECQGEGAAFAPASNGGVHGIETRLALHYNWWHICLIAVSDTASCLMGDR